MNKSLPIPSAEKILDLIHTKKESFWLQKREEQALNVFHRAAVEVPAYRDFLHKNKINPEKIRTFKDFQLVPPTSKKEYLRKYPLEKLCWGGTLEKPLVFTSTSGSTGEPFYFPRSERLDWECSVLAEMFLKNSSYNTGGPTLVIIGFGMGVWIGGLITYKAFEIAAQRGGYPVSIITPGINKAEIFKAFRLLAPKYKEVILVGYAPFLKDVLDEAVDQGINVKKMNLRILTAAEAYTEKFRDYLVSKGRKSNPYFDTLNIYGTADIGAMAWETPTAILARRLAIRNQKLFKEIFSPIEKTPTLAQYNPLFISFEAINKEILLTGNNAIPLIRYAVGDHGGVSTISEIGEKFNNSSINYRKEAQRRNITIFELPFVYVYERTDFSTTLYGLQIYPETIREVLIQKPLSNFLSGKFTMLTKFNKKKDQFLELNLELRKGRKITNSLRNKVLHRIVSNLLHKNSEFKELHDFLGKRAFPKLIFWPAEDAKYFRPGIKQRWTK